MTARITAAPTPVTFKGDDASDRLVSPLVDQEWDMLEEFVQAKVIRIARASLDDSMTDREREEVLNAATREAGKIYLLGGDGQKFLRSIAGMSYMMWLSLRRQQPKITREWCRKTLLADTDNMAAFMEGFNKVNYPGNPPSKAPVEGTPESSPTSENPPPTGEAVTADSP